MNGVGNAICYNIIKSLFNEVEISLKYEDLFDAKTRLKEIFDFYKNKSPTLGELIYKNNRPENSQIVYTEVYQRLGDKEFKLGEGSGALQKISEQLASERSIEILRTRGYSKPIPKEYLTFCK